MTSETLTGAVMPAQGLISTLPSIRGLDSQSMGPREQGGRTGSSHVSQGAYHGRRNAWVSDQKIAIRWA